MYPVIAITFLIGCSIVLMFASMVLELDTTDT